MIELLKKFFNNIEYDQYIEGIYAHEYKDPSIQDKIKLQYKQRYMPTPDPLSHPERFDPLNPPKGWAYDPYYEIWVRQE